MNVKNMGSRAKVKSLAFSKRRRGDRVDTAGNGLFELMVGVREYP